MLDRCTLLVTIAFAVGFSTPASAVCPGDCDADCSVVITELITPMNIALGSAPIAASPLRIWKRNEREEEAGRRKASLLLS